MVNSLDHIIVAVEDLEVAKNNYEKIFGLSPVWRGKHKDFGTSNVLFNFENTYFELLASTGSGLGAELVEKHIKEKGEVKIKISIAEENKNYLFELKDGRKFDYEMLKYLNKAPYIKKISV